MRSLRNHLTAAFVIAFIYIGLHELIAGPHADQAPLNPADARFAAVVALVLAVAFGVVSALDERRRNATMNVNVNVKRFTIHEGDEDENAEEQA